MHLLDRPKLLQPAQTPRPAFPTRDPHTPGYVAAIQLPDGTIPAPTADGNFIIGPTHTPAPETTAPDLTNGSVVEFTMNSADSKYYPGIARDKGTFGTPDPADPAKLLVTTSHPAPYTRKVAVYVPKTYVPGSEAPFIVGADGTDLMLFTALDGLIAEHKLPVMIAISIGNGSGDAQGSERGLEYDTMSGHYAEFVENEVLPRVETEAHVKLTTTPTAAPPWAAVPADPAPSSWPGITPISTTASSPTPEPTSTSNGPPIHKSPHGAWEFHEHLIPQQSTQADPPLDGSRRPRPLQSQRHARQHARLG